jgi:hypothetical protein
MSIKLLAPDCECLCKRKNYPEKTSRIENIVVTAQKKLEPLSEVLIALSAFTGDFITGYINSGKYHH